MLAFPPQAAAPPPPNGRPRPAQDAAPARSRPGRGAIDAGSLTEIRKDVTQLQDAMGERVTNEKVAQSRLTALEERVATIEPPQTAAGDGAEPEAGQDGTQAAR